MKINSWTIAYKQHGKLKARNCFSKKTIIKEYLRLSDLNYSEGISELKVFKNDVEYTSTLNRFLEH